MAKNLPQPKVDYVTVMQPYIGQTLRVKSCTRNSNPAKQGYFITFISTKTTNLRLTVTGYSMSKMKPGSFCTCNEQGFLVPMADVSDYAAIAKVDKAFDKACAKLNFS